MNRTLILLILICCAPLLLLFRSPSINAQASIYEVGPGKPFASINAVPWESLQAGDTVLIYWRSTPYKEKWVLCRQGTSSAPITVRGVLGPTGQLPIIDGNGATTRSVLNFWNQNRGVIKIGGANTPPDTTPKHIIVENLDIRSARMPFTFTAFDGSVQSYSKPASSIYVEKGENITIRNCIIHDSGNGFFVASSDDEASRNILVEANYIFDNGNADSIFEHNNYTAAIGITFQYNRFGPLRAGCLGNNLKDRSAGLVVRYNWIEGGNRQLDLVDGEDSSLIRSDTQYGQTFVYGNVLIEPPGAGNRQITHYGGDSGAEENYRKGTLYFYNNTIVSTRTDRTTLFRLSTNDEHCDFRNNIVYVTAAGDTLSLVDESGVLDLSHNWFKPGRVTTFGVLSGTINDDGSSLVGSSPGFINEAASNYELLAGSSCRNAGAILNPAVPPSHNVIREYFKHQVSGRRLAEVTMDVGAYEYGNPLNTIGLYAPGSSSFFLRNSNSSAPADLVFGYGPAAAGWIPLAGDWNGDGADTIGLYNPVTSFFFLRNTNSSAPADTTFGYGPAGAGWIPVCGDWNGDGADTVGLYDPTTGRFFLRNSNSTGFAELTFSYGPGGAGWKPVIGDWDGDGIDTIGLYNPATSAFFLRNSNTSAPAELVFFYGPGGAGWTPVAADWNGDGIDTIGLFNPAGSMFFLRNTNTSAPADLTFSYGPAGAGWVPVVGDWNGL